MYWRRLSKSRQEIDPEIQVFDDMFRVNLYRRPFLEIADDSGIGETWEKHRRSIGEASEKHGRRFQ